MRKMQKTIFLSLIVWLMTGTALLAQGPPEKGELIPRDPTVLTGVLPNGLKYYIKQNKEPENRAELRLAVNAGSVLEDPDQLGLAHFCEHMAFNGSKHFKKSELVDYLESVGVKFGPHLNAYTSFDETVYMIQVATDDEAILNKGLLVLEDWAWGLTFDHEEIDKERGVVVEEWRLRSGAQSRMMEQYMPVLTNGSHYADRLPIGDPEIIKNFNYDVVKRFYDKWYRPDLMSVVAVGDFDPKVMEQKIKDQFSKVPEKDNKGERPMYEIKDHDDTKVSVAQDKEAQFTVLQVYHKHENRTYKTVADYRDMLIGNLVEGMVNDRLDEIKSKGAPILFSGVGDGPMFGTRAKSAFSLFALLEPSGVQEGMQQVLTEVERARRHGFIKSELERQKVKMLENMERAYKERDKTESRNFAGEYVQHYLNEIPFPGAEWELNSQKEMLPGIKLDEVNSRLNQWLTEKNSVVVLTGPEKDGMEFPSESEIKTKLENLRKADIEPYKEFVDDRPLMDGTPEPGKVTEASEITELDIHDWKLSNGVRVILKPTTFKDDEIQMTAFSWGGNSRASDSDYPSAREAAQIIGQSGIGKFKEDVLDKKMAGKTVFVNPFIWDHQEGFNGYCAPKDFETMLQMVHLHFVAPRQDQDGFTAHKNNLKTFAAMSNSPEGHFRDSLTVFMNQDHPRRQPLKTSEIDKMSLMTAYMHYLDRFMDASDFTFVFVGNFKPEEVKPLVAQYLGSLPGNSRKESWKDRGIRPPEGVVEKSFKQGEAEKSMVNLAFTGKMTYDADNVYNLKSMVQVLRIMLRESMREEKGGVYGVRASARPMRIPEEMFRIDISFTCAPDRVDELIETAMNDIATLKAEGASDKNLQKVKEIQRRERETDLQDNRWWVRTLKKYYEYEEGDPRKIQEYNKHIDGLSTGAVKKAAETFLSMENYAKLVMDPAGK